MPVGTMTILLAFCFLSSFCKRGAVNDLSIKCLSSCVGQSDRVMDRGQTECWWWTEDRQSAGLKVLSPGDGFHRVHFDLILIKKNYPIQTIRSEEYLFGILISACRKVFTRHWLLPEAPTIKEWIDIVNDIYNMEHITFALRLQKEIFIKYWSNWVRYIVPLRPEFVAASMDWINLVGLAFVFICF